MNWDDIKIYLAMIRHGTVRACAEVLEMSHSTVARRIIALEKQVGTRLFDRTPTGYRLTAAGQEISAAAEAMEKEVLSLERRVVGRDQKLTGQVRIATSDFLATHLLIPNLPGYTRQYPGIDIEVVTAYRAHDLDRREADIALRMTAKPPAHLVGRRLAVVAFAPYASRDYLRQHDLKSNETHWIGYERKIGGATPDWVRQTAFPHLKTWGVFESLLSQLAATRSGIGIGMLPCLIGDTEPNLTRLDATEKTPRLPLWLLTHREVRTTARLRTLMQYIAGVVENHKHLIEGRELWAQRQN